MSAFVVHGAADATTVVLRLKVCKTDEHAAFCRIHPARQRRATLLHQAGSHGKTQSQRHHIPQDLSVKATGKFSALPGWSKASLSPPASRVLGPQRKTEVTSPRDAVGEIGLGGRPISPEGKPKKRRMRRRMDKPIDQDRLLELAAQTGTTLESIGEALGVHYTTLYKRFKDDPELKAKYDAARAARPAKESTQKPRTSERTRKTRKRSTPPPQWECQREARQ